MSIKWQRKRQSFMNRLNWIQQEQKVADYHVLTWRTSHFHHPRSRTDITGSFNSQPEGGAGVAVSAKQQPEGIGFGVGDIGSTRRRHGGLGTDGMAKYGAKEAINSEIISTAYRTQGRQTSGPESVTAGLQSIVSEEIYSVVNSAGTSILKVRSRIRRSITKMRDIFLRQKTKQKQPSGISARQGSYRKEPEKERKGTRRVDREEVLSMQAQNRYLLDSYDRKGQYSTLGK